MVTQSILRKICCLPCFQALELWFAFRNVYGMVHHDWKLQGHYLLRTTFYTMLATSPKLLFYCYYCYAISQDNSIKKLTTYRTTEVRFLVKAWIFLLAWCQDRLLRFTQLPTLFVGYSSHKVKHTTVEVMNAWSFTSFSRLCSRRDVSAWGQPSLLYFLLLCQLFTQTPKAQCCVWHYKRTGTNERFSSFWNLPND